MDNKVWNAIIKKKNNRQRKDRNKIKNYFYKTKQLTDVSAIIQFWIRTFFPSLREIWKYVPQRIFIFHKGCLKSLWNIYKIWLWYIIAFILVVFIFVLSYFYHQILKSLKCQSIRNTPSDPYGLIPLKIGQHIWLSRRQKWPQRGSSTQVKI